MPEAREREDYEAASAEIEQHLTQLPGFVALHRLGSVRHPGISDLDRIAVVEGTGPTPSIWAQLSPATRYVAMHGPFLVDVDTFRAHRWFSHLIGLKLASGDRLVVEEPSDPARCDLHLAAEGLARLAIGLVQHARTGRLKVRSTLCAFHAMRISLTLAGLDERAAPTASTFVRAVHDTREAWFSPGHDPAGAMARLMADAPDAVIDALVALDARLEAQRITPHPSPVVLREPYPSVTLVARELDALRADYARAIRPTRLSAVVGHSQRLGKLRWRASTTQVPLPPRVLGLLTQTRAEATPMHRRRRQVIADYSRFLDTRGHGYSHIGLAGPFT